MYKCQSSGYKLLLRALYCKCQNQHSQFNLSVQKTILLVVILSCLRCWCIFGRSVQVLTRARSETPESSSHITGRHLPLSCKALTHTVLSKYGTWHWQMGPYFYFGIWVSIFLLLSPVPDWIVLLFFHFFCLAFQCLHVQVHCHSAVLSGRLTSELHAICCGQSWLPLR